MQLHRVPMRWRFAELSEYLVGQWNALSKESMKRLFLEARALIAKIFLIRGFKAVKQNCVKCILPLRQIEIFA